MPSGGNLNPNIISGFANRLRSVLEISATVGPLVRTELGRQLWDQLYHADYHESDKGGLLGEIIARRTQQKMRLSVTYALLDGAREIRPEHILAAEALWRYCEDSAEYIFAHIDANPRQHKLLNALRNAWPEGLSGTEQRDLFGRHSTDNQSAMVRGALESRGLIETVKVETGGRPQLFSYALKIPRPKQTKPQLSTLWSSFVAHSVTEAPENKESMEVKWL